MILVVDFGSQYTQLLARRLREAGEFSQIVSYAKLDQWLLSSELKDRLKGIVLSGGPNSVYVENAPDISMRAFEAGVPVLGVCYGMQLMNKVFGGTVSAAQVREYGREKVVSQGTISHDHPLAVFTEAAIQDENVVWMSHGDEVQKLSSDFKIVLRSESGSVAAIEHTSKPFIGLQFHPEVQHSVCGSEFLKRFVKSYCKGIENWNLSSEVKRLDSLILEQANAQGSGSEVICALSGGVDSTVAAVLASRVLGKRLHCVFVDNGLLRKDEYQSVLANFREHFHLTVHGVDARKEFMSALKGLTDPELKRKAIGRTFIEVFEREAKALPQVKFLLQGTLYTDVIESVSVHGTSVTIKSHHNVGGLPEKMNLKLIEPLKELFKDEVRSLGEELGIPKAFLWRHPFPGPGLAIRVIGEVTEAKLEVLRNADAIFIDELNKAGLYDQTWQAFCVFLPVSAVGVMGDARTYENVICLRAVTATDGMTADWARLPYDFLGKVSTRLINEVRGVNRVVYDISSKPPATIEWE